MTTITQADIDAVNAFHSASFTAIFNDGGDKQTVGGNMNKAHTLLLEAFAAHRAAAEARARLEGAKAMQWPDQWPLGTRVRKRKGSSWQGRVVGYYSTHLTPRGYAVESERETGSVQIYPKAALEVIDPTQIVGAKP